MPRYQLLGASNLPDFHGLPAPVADCRAQQRGLTCQTAGSDMMRSGCRAKAADTSLPALVRYRASTSVREPAL